MRIEVNASLQAFNSFRFHCIADELVIVRDADELAEALHTDVPITILGEGTNVVLKTHLPGRVIRLAFKSITFEPQADGSTLVSAGAGVNWHELVRSTLGQGIAGLENLALIPGSVGAAPYQNIGAYGVELADLVETVQVFDRQERTLHDLSVAECDFAYRDSTFKSNRRDRYVVCRLTLRLGNSDLNTCYRDVARVMRHRSRSALTATQLAEIVNVIRRRKLPDPRVVGNVGSFFKNPMLNRTALDLLRGTLTIDAYAEGDFYKVSAARLIDEAGWKDVTHGSAQVWSRQPLVIVDRSKSTAHNVLDLASRIADDIHRRFDVQLELEPVVLGSFKG